MKTLILCFLLSLSLGAYEKKETPLYLEYKIKASYDDVIFSLLDEISNQGFILSYRANIGKNINKTAKFFKEKELYTKANKIGFCKSSLSLKMMGENIRNILFCPLNAAVYELPNKDKEIKILYLKANPINKDEKVMLEVNRIINELIVQALENLR